MFYGSFDSSDTPISSTLSDSSRFETTLPSSPGTAAFFGFTSPVPITSITVDNRTGIVDASVFDVVSFSVAPFVAGPGVGAVPEPASWTMLIAGFGLAGAAMRRSRRLAAA
jgi:hypothetical protein